MPGLTSPLLFLYKVVVFFLGLLFFSLVCLNFVLLFLAVVSESIFFIVTVLFLRLYCFVCRYYLLPFFPLFSFLYSLARTAPFAAHCFISHL